MLLFIPWSPPPLFPLLVPLFTFYLHSFQCFSFPLITFSLLLPPFCLHLFPSYCFHYLILFYPTLPFLFFCIYHFASSPRSPLLHFPLPLSQRTFILCPPSALVSLLHSTVYCLSSLHHSISTFATPPFSYFFPFLSFCFSFKVQSFVHYLHYKQGWHLHKCWSQWTCLGDVSGQTAHTHTRVLAAFSVICTV